MRGVSALLLPVLCALCASGGAAARADVLGDVTFPLYPSANQRYLEDVFGRPFLMNGDAAWSLMVVPTQAEAELYLETRRQQGFNTVLVNLIERGFGGPENAEGEPPFLVANDFTTPNEAYFAYADWVIDRAAEKGMLVLLTPAYLGLQCGSQGWCEQMLDQPLSAMTEYGRYLGNRYRNRNNIIWVNGGDVRASSFGATDHVNALADGIRETAPNQLQTGHCSRNNSGIECYDEPWLDINTTYSNCSSTLGAVLDDYDRNPAQVFFYIEGVYENNGGSSLGCLIDQEAWSVLGGATGHVFGNDPIWRFGEDWQDALESPGALAMKWLSRLFLSRAWFRLLPDTDGSVLVSGASDDAIAAQTDDGESILVYVPAARTISVNLDGLSSDLARAWWFDPVTGTHSAIGTVTAIGNRSFTSPGRRVLVVDDFLKALDPPGFEPYPIPVPEPAGAPELYAAAGAALCGLLRLHGARRHPPSSARRRASPAATRSPHPRDSAR